MSDEPVSKSDFKARALEYFRHVEATGESIIVTDKGRPVVQVRRYHSDRRRPLERLRGTLVEYSKPTEPADPEDWAAMK